MSIKEIQVSLYDVFSAIADDWMYAFMPVCLHDCSDSMHTMNAAEDMLSSVSKSLGHPTTMVNFVKAYKKAEYVKAVKEYLEENGEELADAHFATSLPIKVTQKDLDKA